jgi:hypothetical protein
VLRSFYHALENFPNDFWERTAFNGDFQRRNLALHFVALLKQATYKGFCANPQLTLHKPPGGAQICHPYFIWGTSEATPKDIPYKQLKMSCSTKETHSETQGPEVSF